MLHAIIFDLDNTLFDTRSIPARITQPVYAALRTVNEQNRFVSNETLERVFQESWFVPFPAIAAAHGLPECMVKLWESAQQQIRFSEPLHPYPDVVDALRKITLFKCLLTSGYRQVQEGKIRALGIGSLFDLIRIDAVDDPVHYGKRQFMEELMQNRGWLPSELLVVGDSAANEIAAGRALGIPTVQILRPGVIRTELADRHIQSLTELI